MDAVQTLFYIITLLIVGFGALQIYKIKLSGTGNSPQGWESIKEIVYDVINEASALYEAKLISQNAFKKQVIKTIKEKIDETTIFSDADKKFWTEERISNLIQPIIEITLQTLNQKLR